MRDKIRILSLGFGLVLIDQFLKYLILSNFNLFDSQKIIPHFFSLTYVRNTGAAFSVLEGKISFFVLLSIGILLYFGYYLVQTKNIPIVKQVVYSLLFGGIVGNLIDRLRFGAVIDYLDVQFGTYQFAIFNFADCCIVIGGMILLLLAWKEEIYEIHHRKRGHNKTN